MAKWAGKIGFVITAEETYPNSTQGTGVWKETSVERTYYGDLNRNRRRLQSSGNVNDNVTIANELSIVADPFANENFHAIRYAEYMGAKWKVTDIEVQRPRLILTLGEVDRNA